MKYLNREEAIANGFFLDELETAVNDFALPMYVPPRRLEVIMHRKKADKHHFYYGRFQDGFLDYFAYYFGRMLPINVLLLFNYVSSLE